MENAPHDCTAPPDIGDAPMSDEPQGFATIPRAMLYDTDVPRDAKLIYLVLSSHVGGNRMAWPSHKRMADLAGMSKSQAKLMLRYLEEHGYVRIMPRRDADGVAMTNEYQLIAGSTQPSKKVGQVVTHPGQDVTHLGQEVTHGGSGGDPRVGQVVTGGGSPGDYERESLNDEEPSTSAAPPRADVEALCTRLADKIETNGSKRPAVTKAWRDACRLLIDKDGRTPTQVAAAIDWCQGDEFWRANVLSMPTLRKQYDRLRLAAQRPRGVRDLDAERAAVRVQARRSPLASAR